MRILLLVLLALPLRAEVREIVSMSEIAPALTPGTLLVLDIDNTLVEPVGNIGSDQWYYYLEKAYRRDGLEESEAETKAGDTWTKAQATVAVKPVEPLTPGFVRAQQARGLKVMALTARGPEDATATFRQLAAIGVDFSVNPVSKQELKTPHKGLYSRGVFFVGEGPDKGKTLAAFLKTISLRPKKIVFVDDKPHHARNVDAAMTAAGLTCTAFRYGAADAKVAAFNAVMSEAADARSAAMLFYGREEKK